MEKWVRGLSQTTALILGGASGIAFLVIAGTVYFNNFGGFLSLILLSALIGGGGAFSAVLIIKGVTGKTPQERKEAQQGR